MDRFITWIHPLMLTLGYAAFVFWVDPPLWVKGAFALLLLITLGMWFLSRQIKVRVSIGRLIANGEPELARRLVAKTNAVSKRGRAWLAISHGACLFWLGQFDRAQEVLWEVDLTAIGGANGVRLQYERDWYSAMCALHQVELDEAQALVDDNLATLATGRLGREFAMQHQEIVTYLAASRGQNKSDELGKIMRDVRRPQVRRAIARGWALRERDETLGSESIEAKKLHSEAANTFVGDYYSYVNWPEDTDSEPSPPALAHAPFLFVPSKERRVVS